MKFSNPKKHASYFYNGMILDSFMSDAGFEYIRLPQKRIDYGFGKPRWETPYIEVPYNAIKLRDKT